MSRSSGSLVAAVDVARTPSARENSNVHQPPEETARRNSPQETDEEEPAEEVVEKKFGEEIGGNKFVEEIGGRRFVEGKVVGEIVAKSVENLEGGKSVEGIDEGFRGECVVGDGDGFGDLGALFEQETDEETDEDTDEETVGLEETDEEIDELESSTNGICEAFSQVLTDSCHSGYEGDTGSLDSEDEEDVAATAAVCRRCCYRQEPSVRILAARHRRDLVYNVFKRRMVLEPKFADYGSIQSIGEMVVGHQSHQQSTDSSGSLVPSGTLNALTGADQEIATVKMTQGDLYQRQPLLPAPARGDKWGHGSHPTPAKEYYEDDEENILEKSHQESNGIIKINIPTPVREEPSFPQERWKTLIALVIFFFSSILVLISLATVHERVPDRKTYGPLPDIFYEIMGAHDWGLTVSEYLIIFSFNSTIVVIFLHKHRFILARRLFLIMSLLYMYRALTMFVTVLPISSTTYYCSPKNNNTSTLEMTKRVLQMLSGMGLSINGKQTYCGDFIYSGHTLILVLSYLFIAEYTPKKLYIVHWLYWLSAAVGVFMLELSRSHYTIDVILAYYVTTRLFWIYHTLANNQRLKQHSERNLLGRTWWFNFFLYFEGNIGGQVPRQWPDWPFPWPRRFQTKSRDS